MSAILARFTWSTPAGEVTNRFYVDSLAGIQNVIDDMGENDRDRLIGIVWPDEEERTHVDPTHDKAKSTWIRGVDDVI